MSFTPPPPPPPPLAPYGAQPSGYPAQLDVTSPDVARWQPMFNWILAIPHFVVQYFLNIAMQVVALISWFVIVFTGKLPAGLANFQCMCLRYTTRIMAYAGGLVGPYPPFEFGTTPNDTTGYAAQVNFAPALEGRNRLTVALRLIWMIPAAIVTLIIGLVGFVCWFIGAIVVLFTGKWPEGLRSWVLKAIRASTRFNAYANLLTDEYPPLSFD
jgi:hypothetical protein